MTEGTKVFVGLLCGVGMGITLTYIALTNQTPEEFEVLKKHKVAVERCLKGLPISFTCDTRVIAYAKMIERKTNRWAYN